VLGVFGVGGADKVIIGTKNGPQIK